MPSIQSITEQNLVDAISAAKQRVVYVAPGIWPEVAHALADAWRRLGADQVTVILDIDPEICRFGYGSIEGLAIVEQVAQSLNQAIGQEPGIRICIVIADDQTFIFSPTPRLIECAPGAIPDPKNPSGQAVTTPRANGIVLASPPAAIERDLGATPELAAERTIGNEAVDNQKVEEVTKDLKQNPPKKFDLARAVNVYNAAVQFAEFKVTGCRLSGHKASLPSELIKVARKNPALDKKIDKSLRLIEDEDDLITNETLSQDTIFAERKRIEEAYLVHVKGGTIIDRKKTDEFNSEVVEFKKLIKNFSDLVSGDLNDRYLATAEQLATELLPDVLNDIPPAWIKKLGKFPEDSEVKYRIKDALLKAFGNPDRRVNAMKADVVYKDVTYDMLKDPEFIQIIAENFPGLEHVVEYTAAKEAPKKTDDLFSTP
jgi:hypothetical protein